MKKILILALVFTTLLSLTAFAEPDTIKFRGHEWGENIDKIFEAEISDDMVENVDYGWIDGALAILNGSVSVFKCYTYFNYNDDKQLYAGIYFLTEEHANDNKYYDDFKTLEEALITVYGDPTISIDDWSDDLYKNDPSDIGIAIAAEHLILKREWHAKDGSLCQLACYGQNYQIRTIIGYTAPDDLNLEPENDTKTNGL